MLAACYVEKNVFQAASKLDRYIDIRESLRIAVTHLSQISDRHPDLQSLNERLSPNLSSRRFARELHCETILRVYSRTGERGRSRWLLH